MPDYEDPEDAERSDVDVPTGTAAMWVLVGLTAILAAVVVAGIAGAW